MLKSALFRMLLPFSMVALLTVVAGLPSIDSHAEGIDSGEASEAEGATADDSGGAADDSTAGAKTDTPAEQPADDAAHEPAKALPWDETGAPAAAAMFLEHIGQSAFSDAYEQASPLLRSTRTEEELKADIDGEGLAAFASVIWENGVSTPGGLRLDGVVTLKDGATLPIFATVLEEGDGQWFVLDVQAKESFMTRLGSGTANGLDWLVAAVLLSLLGAFVYIIWKYARGLKRSPRDLYLRFFT